MTFKAIGSLTFVLLLIVFAATDSNQTGILGQQICQRLIQKPTNSLGPMTDSAKILNSSLCGINLEPSNLKTFFLETQLIHLLVVSAGHLYLIQKYSQPISSSGSMLLICCYCFLTGMQAPALRALISIWIEDKLAAKNIRLSNTFKSILPSLVCLTLNPTWILSTSLYLSTLVNLGSSLTAAHSNSPGIKPNSFNKFVLNCFWIQILVSLYFSSFNFLGLMMNLTLGLILGLTLLPMCLIYLGLTLVMPLSFHSYPNFAFNQYIGLIRRFEVFIEIFRSFQANVTTPYSDRNWLFLAALISILHCVFVLKGRSK